MPIEGDLADLLARADAWLADDPDPATRAELAGVIDAARAGSRAPRPPTTWPTASPGCSSSAPRACAASWGPARTG